MNRTTTISWKFYTSSIEGKVKCATCGKPIVKYFSTKYREDSEPDFTDAKKCKEEWESASHICNTCLRKNMVSQGNVVSMDFSKIINAREAVNKIRESIQTDIEELSRQLKGKVVRYEDAEYVVQYMNLSPTSQIYLECKKVNKQSPWCLTNGSKYFYLENEYFKCGELSDIVFTDEVFADRHKAIREWEKENK